MAAVAIFTGILVQQSDKSSQALPDLEKVVILPNSRTLQAANFLDHTGAVFTVEDLKGYWNIIFFGFTNCPDICPTTMRTLAQVKQSLVEQNSWGKYRVIMVSVDPERDSIERLNNYVPYFDEEFIGLQSDVETTTNFAKQLGILFVKQEAVDGFYEVDHSVSMILVNPKAEMAGVITAPHNIEQINGDLALLAEHFSDDHAAVPTSHVASNIDTNVVAQSAHTDSPLTITNISDGNAVIQGLEIEGAWIRPAPPRAPSLAAYFTLKNQSSTDITIVATQSPDFGMATIHDTIMEGEVAKMSHRTSITIEAGGHFELAPLQTHMMLMQPKKQFVLGDTTEITLISETGARFTQRIEVKDGSSEN